MWTSADARRSREATCQLTELAEAGVLDWETLARELMGWLSDAEVRSFAEAHRFLEDEGEQED